MNLKYQLQRGMINIKLPDGPYVPDIQDSFKYITKKHQQWLVIYIGIYVNKSICKIEDRITFNFKTGHYFYLLMSETKIR